ncbi:hypothetical protein KAZ01_02705 [Candidatus Gracilibacteria bacterium]|nr:hypothetical protein [Candidatus Gracilibacteria bacterium]
MSGGEKPGILDTIKETYGPKNLYEAYKGAKDFGNNVIEAFQKSYEIGKESRVNKAKQKVATEEIDKEKTRDDFYKRFGPQGGKKAMDEVMNP